MESKDVDDDAFTAISNSKEDQKERKRELIIHEIFISHQNPKTARAQKRLTLPPTFLS